MKNLVIILIISTLSGLAFSQNFGIDQPSPTEKLDVNGWIKTSQGIKFPDGTVQTTAAVPPDNRHIIWSGGSTSHGTAGGWNRYYPNGQSTFSNAQTLGYVSSDGSQFTFHVAGYYRVSLWWINLGCHGCTTDTDWYKNGSRVFYKHSKTSGSSGAWDGHHADATYYFNAGDTFYMNIHNPQNYAYHAWNVCECWHSRVQVSYMGTN